MDHNQIGFRGNLSISTGVSVLNAEKLKQFFHRTREWARATRGMQLFQMASVALDELVEADSGFFIYQKRGLVPGLSLAGAGMYAPWGVFRDDQTELAEALAPLLASDVTLKSPMERWILAEDIEPPLLCQLFSKYPLLEIGVWPIISREQLIGSIVVARTRAVSDRMTTEMSNALVDSCAAQISVALDLILALRIAEQASERDLLTGLLNRRGIESHLGFMAERQREKNTCLVFGVLDLDDFKVVNDTYGHPGGDEALRLVAKILVNCFDPDALVGRYGGDEFVVAFHCYDNDWVSPMRRVQMAVWQESGMYSVSVGGAIWGMDGSTLDKCYEIADERLYADKRERKLDRMAHVETMF